MTVISASEREEICTAVARVIAEKIKEAMTPVDARLKTLEFKLAQIEIKARQLRYAGVWVAGVCYRQGNFISHAGSLWHCNFDTETQPGKDFDAWQLVCKRGQDGGMPRVPTP
jgi:hypothetical protein